MGFSLWGLRLNCAKTHRLKPVLRKTRLFRVFLHGDRTRVIVDEWRSLPKIELHLHLDCSLSYRAVSTLAPAVTYEE